MIDVLNALGAAVSTLLGVVVLAGGLWLLWQVVRLGVCFLAAMFAIATGPLPPSTPDTDEDESYWRSSPNGAQGGASYLEGRHGSDS